MVKHLVLLGPRDQKYYQPCGYSGEGGGDKRGVCLCARETEGGWLGCCNKANVDLSIVLENHELICLSSYL